MKYVCRIVSIAVTLGLAFGFLLPESPPTAQAKGLSILVDDDGVECPTATRSTIDAAVNDINLSPAKSGTITVCPGTYAEQVILFGVTNVKLIGKPGAKIIPPTTPSPFISAIVVVEESANVTVQGFIIDGAGRFSDTGEHVAGIIYSLASGTVTRNYISNIHATNRGDTCVGTSIDVVYAQGPTKVFNNTVYDFGCKGIGVSDSPKTVVQKNLLWATFAYGAQPNGIIVATSDYSSITSNTVSADWHPGASSWSEAIRLLESSYVKISGNQVSHFYSGIYAATSHYLQNADNLTISANRINDVKNGITILAVTEPLTTDSPSSNNDKITGNTFYAPTYAGYAAIWLYTEDTDGTDTFVPSLTNTTISGNKQFGFSLFSGKIVNDNSGGVTNYSTSNKTVPPPTGS